jgi:4-diphosphocytidyl-2-C-methyl-D-erythritol kinase
VRDTAYAKINLALHVRERMPDGYHRIETVFAFADDGDELQVAEGEGLALTVTGPFAAGLSVGEDNLVLRAARALSERYRPGQGAALALDKRLPVAAGIGGGSADAAAALRLLSRWWKLEPDEASLLAVARRLGSDVPACPPSLIMRGEGRGDDLVPLEAEGLSGTPLLLVNPAASLSTASVFAAWDGKDDGPLDHWQDGHNGLERAALHYVPAIEDVRDALGGARFARMSGSGPTCFGLYDSDKDRDLAEARIRAAHPDWWTLATRLR